MAMVIMTNCETDKNSGVNPVNQLEDKYFSIENATYQGGRMPSSNSGVELDIRTNVTVLAGGSNLVTIDSEVSISDIYVGVDKENGYYVLPPQSTGRGFVYVFSILLSQNLNQDFTILFSANTSSGVSKLYSAVLEYKEQGTGALQISLSFDQDKDVDLYVVQPDGEVVYYGNRGYWDYFEDENGDLHYGQIWGLDLDSNAGCGIDGINNENIYYPQEYLLTGKYEVWVNMWENCYPQNVPTNWTIVTTFNGTRIRPSWGNNPAYGTFPYDEPSNNISSSLYGATKVMEFTIQGSSSVRINKGTQYPMSESAKMKLEASK